MKCEVCSKHYCIDCVEIAEKHFNVLQNCPSAHWYCSPCESKAMKVLRDDYVVEERCKSFLKNMEERMKHMEEKLERMKHMEEELENRPTEDKIKELVETFLAENRKHVSENGKHVSENGKHVIAPESQVKEVVATMLDSHSTEQQDKESRKMNIIIHNVDENEKEAADVNENEVATEIEKEAADVSGKKPADESEKEAADVSEEKPADESESDEADKDYLTGLTSALEIQEPGIANFFRLGKLPAESSKPRPLKVIFNSETSKKYFMSKLGKLAEAPGKFKKISVCHDMTNDEREENRKLVAEAKNMTKDDTTGKWVFRVKGLPGKRRIVRMEKKN